MGALCSADTTAMTAWRLFMSHSFYEKFQHIRHALIHADSANIHMDKTTMSCCLPWQCECTCSAPRLWSLKFVHEGSPAPPRSLSGKTKTDITAPSNTRKTRQKQTSDAAKLMTVKDLSQSQASKHNDDFKYVQSKTGSSALLNVYSMGAKFSRKVMELWAETNWKHTGSIEKDP